MKRIILAMLLVLFLSFPLATQAASYDGDVDIAVKLLEKKGWKVHKVEALTEAGKAPDGSSLVEYKTMYPYSGRTTGEPVKLYYLTYIRSTDNMEVHAIFFVDKANTVHTLFFGEKNKKVSN